jgi:hypothetical protein
MGWFVHYWDEIDKRNVCSDATSEQQGAMLKACCLMREGRVVSHVAGPNGERVDIMDLRKWCAARHEARASETSPLFRNEASSTRPSIDRR